MFRLLRAAVGGAGEVTGAVREVPLRGDSAGRAFMIVSN
jgi:hypothetical protein